MNIVSLLKKYTFLMDMVSFIYTLLYSPLLLKYWLPIFRGGNNVSIKGAFLKRVKINVQGNNAKVYIGRKVMMTDCVISISGENSIISIEGGGTNIHHSSFVAGMDSGKIMIEQGFTSEGCYIKAHEGKTIKIGQDCMFSAGINVSTTDFHSMISIEDNKRMNVARDIIIGNHVWLARNVNVLKGCTIADDVVVGMGSTASGHLSESHTVYAGVPARKIKEKITWNRELI